MFKNFYRKLEEAGEEGSIDWGGLADQSLMLDLSEDGVDDPPATIVNRSAAESPVTLEAPVQTQPKPAVKTEVEEEEEEEFVPASKVVETPKPAEPETTAPVPGTPPAEEDPFLSQPVYTEQPQSNTQQRDAIRAQALPQLREAFKMTDAQLAEFETDPSSVLSDMFARAYLDITQNVVHSIFQQMPSVVRSVQARESKDTALDKAFYGKWKSLDTIPGREKVQQIGSVMMKTNPRMSVKDYIDTVGAAASVALQLPIGNEQPASAIPEMHGFKPARQSVSQMAPVKSSNPFSVLAEEFEDF